MGSLLDRELDLIFLVVAKNSCANMFNRVEGQGSIYCVNLARKIGSDVFPSFDMNLKVRVEEDTVSIQVNAIVKLLGLLGCVLSLSKEANGSVERINPQVHKGSTSKTV